MTYHLSSLPSAAIKVPPPSLNLSTASSTSTNFPLPANSFSMLTHSALRFSVRAYGLRSIFSSLNSSSASTLAATMRSRRCRAVMHSRTLMIVCCMRERWKKERNIEDLPVAVRPWIFRKGGDGRCAWVVVSTMVRKSDGCTDAIESCKMVDLLVAALKFSG